MAYFLGAVFPILMLVVGAGLLLLGMLDRDGSVLTAGAVLLAGLFVGMRIGK
ncbi:MAG: hypothetical protein AAGJ46_10220 [Planctomycetota bacterium]